MAANKAPGCAWRLAWVMALASTLAAGSPRPVGSLVGCRNTMLDGQKPLPHTTVLSGDRLQVNEGLAMVTLERGTRVILGRESEATFLRDAGAVKLSLARGNLAIYHPKSVDEFYVEAGGVRVTPARDSRSLGEVTMVDGQLSITAKVGVLRVEVSGVTREVRHGRTLTINLQPGRSAVPGFPGRTRPKHVSSHKELLNTALLAMGAAAVASLALIRTSHQSSPITPTY